MVELVRAHIQSLFPTISRSWCLVFCFLLRKGKNQAFISCVSEGSIGSHCIFARPQKWPETRFLELLTPFLSKTRTISLLQSPDSDSTGKNLSKMSDSVFNLTIAAPHLTSRLGDWCILEATTMSNHQCIEFSIQ